MYILFILQKAACEKQRLPNSVPIKASCESTGRSIAPGEGLLAVEAFAIQQGELFTIPPADCDVSVASSSRLADGRILETLLLTSQILRLKSDTKGGLAATAPNKEPMKEAVERRCYIPYLCERLLKSSSLCRKPFCVSANSACTQTPHIKSHLSFALSKPDFPNGLLRLFVEAQVSPSSHQQIKGVKSPFNRMLRNTVLSTTTFFYPLGNTPAACLTQDLPPDQDADILLLGCGDARNILLTSYVGSGMLRSLRYGSFTLTLFDRWPP